MRYAQGETPSSPNPTDADRGERDMIPASSSHVAARPAYSGPRPRWLPRNRWSQAQTTIGAVTIDSFVPMPSAHATMAAALQRREVRLKPDPTNCVVWGPALAGPGSATRIAQ